MAFKVNIPWKLVIAYFVDWLVILAIALVGYGFAQITPPERNFSLLDLRISYPNQHEAISVPVLIVCTLIIPGLLIALINTLFFPVPSSLKDFKTWKFWQRKIWEGNAGVMGLALSYAIAFIVTQVVKNSVGKHRPDFLSRCRPDLSNVEQYYVGGAGRDISIRWGMVSPAICRPEDQHDFEDGFRSFFSGHSSSAFGGLVYLALWFAVKFNITIPFVQQYTAHELETAAAQDPELLPTYNTDVDSHARKSALVNHHPVHLYRRTGAAPPVWGMVFIFTPILFAIYIASTRYVESRHDGFDVICGSLMGVLSSWIGYRWYHASLLRGQSWTWAPRLPENAFVVRSSATRSVALNRRKHAVEKRPSREHASDEYGRHSTEVDPEQAFIAQPVAGSSANSNERHR